MGDGDLDLRDSVLTNNRTVASALISGGACRVSGEVRSVNVSSCQFLSNGAEVFTSQNSRGTNLFVNSFRQDAECVVDTVFAGHRNASQIDGLCLFSNLESLVIQRCRWIDSQADYLISLSNCTTSSIENSAITGNEVDQLILLSFGIDLTILNTTVAGNDAGAVFRRIAAATAGTIDIDNSIIVENLEDNFDAALTVARSHSYVSEFAPNGNGNVSPASMGFINSIDEGNPPTAAGNYRLSSSSPLINVGSNFLNTATLDLDGDLRVFGGDDDGTATIDLGAYESGLARVVAIEAISYNEATGVVTLSVRSDGTTSFTAQSSPNLSDWQSSFDGMLGVGLNTVNLPAGGDRFFRIVFPAG